MANIAHDLEEERERAMIESSEASAQRVRQIDELRAQQASQLERIWVQLAEQRGHLTGASARNSGRPSMNHVWPCFRDIKQIAKTPEVILVFEFPPRARLLGVDTNTTYGLQNQLVVRRSGQMFAQMALARLLNAGNVSKHKNWILTGTPGTGKSVLCNYLLKLCWDNDLYVIQKTTQPRSPTFVLRPGEEAREYALTAKEAYNLLIDEVYDTVYRRHGSCTCVMRWVGAWTSRSKRSLKSV